jgi:hypothetical protein
MSKLLVTLVIVGGFAAVIAQQEGKLTLPTWVTIVPTLQTAVDKDAADYGAQFKQIHLQAEKDVLAHKYGGPTAAKDLHDWLSAACDAARSKSFAGVSKPLKEALIGPDGKPVAFDEQGVAAACRKIATQ